MSRSTAVLRRLVAGAVVLCAALVAGAQTLTVTSSLSSLTLHAGDTNVSLPVTVTADASVDTVVVSLSGLPYGVSAMPIALTPGATGALLLNATSTAGAPSFSGEILGAQGATSNISVVAAAGGTSVSLTLPLTISLSNPYFAPAAGKVNLPILSINTNGVAVTTKSTAVPGTFTVTSADGNTFFVPSSTITDNTMTLAVHGNSTAQMPKLPYNLNLTTSADLLAAIGVNCGYVLKSGAPTCDKNSHYVLLANYADKTMLRDWAASALALSIPNGSPYLAMSAASPTPTGTTTLSWWAPHSAFVELYLNGSYSGVYQLIEKVEVDSHRVNIRKMNQTDTTGSAVTGGYLLEIDSSSGEDYMFTTPSGLPIGMVAPDFSPETVAQETYISNYVATAENALMGTNYTSATLGWRPYFDLATLVDFYLVNDLMGNIDGGNFCCSDYLYKDQSNALIYMGPVWDFDASGGNLTVFDQIVNPFTPWMLTQASWYKRLITDPYFKAAAAKQFNALNSNGVFSAWIASIQAQASGLQQGQTNNFARWPMLGVTVWRNPVAPGTFSDEVNYFTNWLKQRIVYMNGVLNNTVTTAAPVASLEQATDSLSGTNVTYPNNTLNFSGWAASYTDNGQAKSVQILIDWAPVGNATLGIARPDVAAQSGNSAWGTTGWTFSLKPVTLSVGSHLVTALATDSAGLMTSSNLATITVSPAPVAPGLAFVPIATKTAGAGPFTVAALSASPAAITYTVSSGPATVSGSTVTVTGSGTVMLSASQAATTGYLGASVSTTFAVNPAPVPPGLTFTPIPSLLASTSPFAAVVSTASPAPVTYTVVSGPATVSGATVTLTGSAGTVVLSASQPAVTGYTSATATTSFPVVTVLHHPLGGIDSALDNVTHASNVSQMDSVVITGWAADYNDNGPAQSVTVLIDGVAIGRATQGLSRPDVAAAYNNPAWANTGWTITLKGSLFSVGSHTVAATLVDTAGWVKTLSGPAFSISGGTSFPAPIGVFDLAVDSTVGTSQVSQAGSLLVRGWAAAYSSNGAASSVQILIDGVPAGLATLGLSRPDVAAAFGNSNWANTGWALTLSAAGLSVGPHTLQATITDSAGVVSRISGPGITVSAGAVYLPPTGVLDSATDSVSGTSSVSQSDSLVVRGWAADYADNGPAQSVAVYLDGVSFGAATLGLSRPDVAAAYNNPAWANAGWTLSRSAAALSAGPHTLKAVATNSRGVSTTLSSLGFTVTASAVYPPPLGTFDAAVDSVSGTSTVLPADSVVMNGWAVDYSANGPVRSVQVLVDGAPAGMATLNGSRPDVAAAYNNPAWASAGWNFSLSAAGLSVGSHTVSALATDSAGLTALIPGPSFTVSGSGN